MTAPTPPSTRRPGLALVCALHALVFAVAAKVGPVVPSSWFALSLWPLVLLHALLAAFALGRHGAARGRVWTALALYSLLWLAAMTWIITESALYIVDIYGGMGEAVAGALACIWAVIVLFTLPIASWGLHVAKPAWLWRKRSVVAVSAVAVIALCAACSLRTRAQLEPVGTRVERVAQALEPIARAHAGTPEGQAPASILQFSPAVCARPLHQVHSLLVTTLDGNRRPLSRCLQTTDEGELLAALQGLLEHASPSAPIKLDLVRGTQRIARANPLLDSLALRPALDGVCAREQCLAPWQLVALDAFTQNHPMSSMHDASFGVSLPLLAMVLGAPQDAPLTRIDTASWVIDQHALRPLVRGRPPAAPLTDEAIDRAVAAAGAHIVAAERANGTFRYTLDPFTGRYDDRMVSMRRQAGTVFALCELLPAAQIAEPADRALALLRSYEHRYRDLAMLSERDDLAEIGPSALPLIAFAACRHAVGPKYDDLIGGMARFLLTLQREDGAFYPEFELTTGRPRGDFESLYAGGQTMLGLILVEQLVRASPSPHWPDAAQLHRGIERAMNHYGKHYWPRPLRSLFFIEENWHCLAARAALRSHRNEDYEQFCLDYARFKRRWILGEEASPEHVGGYSMSDIFPPHAAVTAGFGETLSAALEIEHARGMDLREDQALLRSVLSWLLRQQWSADTCFACGAGGEAIGGFSEHTASPKIRIDYVQHAMAALRHGKQALSLR